MTSYHLQGHAVAQLVEALRYKSEGRGFDPSGRTMSLGSTQPLIELSTRNISWGAKGGRCVGLTTLPPSCADCLEIWGLNLLEPSGPVQACNGIALPPFITFSYSDPFNVGSDDIVNVYYHSLYSFLHILRNSRWLNYI